MRPLSTTSQPASDICFSVAYPLARAASVRLSSWAIQILYKIGHIVGIRLATVLVVLRYCTA